ncbi:hypothetical protein ACH5RR_027008 [Cinchona calisaya]|uniref:Reverse transcriptase domain-containing protein n=1 Tax=Cinchona calisaya TaxID=153742 RepID=A0ABD2Z475_9GENT
MGKLLPKIISPEQGGFVQGRVISENILLAQELVDFIDKKTRRGNVILKLDMTKTFDRISWQFLYAILKQFGFSDNWITLVASSLETCWYSVLLNGFQLVFSILLGGEAR